MPICEKCQEKSSRDLKDMSDEEFARHFHATVAQVGTEEDYPRAYLIELPKTVNCMPGTVQAAEAFVRGRNDLEWMDQPRFHYLPYSYDGNGNLLAILAFKRYGGDR